MELNRLVFPSPSSSYTHEMMNGKLLYIPKFKQSNDISSARKKLSRESVNSVLLMESTNLTISTYYNHNSAS